MSLHPIGISRGGADVRYGTNGLTKEPITKLNPTFVLDITNKVRYNNDLCSWAAIQIANQYVD